MEQISVPIKTHFEMVESVNKEFTKCKCYVMALGKNRNRSYFSRETVENAIATFKNIPVISHLYEDDDDNLHAAGHAQKLVENNGVMSWHTNCVPYGVVSGDSFSFEEVQEKDGSTATYLCTDVILWTGKYPEILDAAYSKDCLFNQSMEISVEEARKLKEDDRYMEITKFSASALCLLGKSDDPEYNVEPCFPSSSIIPYSFDEHFSELMNEFKTALAECFSNKINENGGENRKMDQEKICSILAEFNLTAEQLDFEISEEMTEEELREKLSAYGNVEPVVEGSSEENYENGEELENGSEPNKEPEKAEFSSTYNEKRKALCDAVAKLDKREEDLCVWNYLCDFDDEYVYIERDVYTEAEETHTLGRMAYSISEELEVNIESNLEEMFVKWVTAEELEEINRMRSEFEAYCESHSTSNEEVEELRQFKADRLAADHNAEVESVLSSFEDLEGNADFEELKKTAYSIDDMDVLTDKCYALRGRAVKVSQKKSKEVKAPIIKEMKTVDEEEPYGGLFAMYGRN